MQAFAHIAFNILNSFYHSYGKYLIYFSLSTSNYFNIIMRDDKLLIFWICVRKIIGENVLFFCCSTYVSPFYSSLNSYLIMGITDITNMYSKNKTMETYKRLVLTYYYTVLKQLMPIKWERGTAIIEYKFPLPASSLDNNCIAISWIVFSNILRRDNYLQLDYFSYLWVVCRWDARPMHSLGQ